jgi:hypothetical protein
MADRSKFEEMLELLINENREAAEELFHELVVSKSRKIYESLLEDEEEVDESDDEEVDESDDEEVDESDEELDESEDDDLDESDEELDEYFDLDEFEVEADDVMMGGDETDDMMGDLEGGMDGMDDMGDEGDTDGRLADLEDAFEELKAEFDAMMAGDEEGEDDDMFGGEEGDDEEGEEDDMFGGDEEGDEEEEDEDDEESKESFTYEAKKAAMKKDSKKEKKTAGEEMREYVEKIGGDRYNAFGKMGDNGTQTKSPVAGKNDMGGTAQNILRGGSENGVEANKGKIQGSALNNQSPKDMNTKNINVAGGKAGVKHLKTQNGGGLDKNSILKTDSSDKGAKSPINGVKTRAK